VNEATEIADALAGAEADAVIDQITDSAEIEALASEIGWKPASEWKGEGHMPASTFLKNKAARADEKSAELKQVNRRLEKLARTSGAILDRSLREQREELEGRYADLVAANKPQEARRVSQQIDALENPADDKAIVDDFKARNSSWYGKDEDATAYADSISIREAQKNKSFEEQLEAVDIAVKKRFPELFPETASARRQPVVVGSPTSRATPSRSKEFTKDTLPSDAKQALAGYLARMTPDKHERFTKSYLTTYNEENGQ
jgi:hypothetical protein